LQQQGRLLLHHIITFSSSLTISTSSCPSPRPLVPQSG
jgi:hypothetical protein